MAGKDKSSKTSTKTDDQGAQASGAVKLLSSDELRSILATKLQAPEGKEPELDGQKYREHSQLSPGVPALQLLKQRRSILFVLPSKQELYELEEDLLSLGLEPLVFPDWGTALYHGIRSQSRIFAQRSQVLAQVIHQAQELEKKPEAPPLLLLSTLRASSPTLPPASAYARQIHQLKIGQDIQPQDLATLLTQLGYYQVPRVTLPGEFALRGEVLDYYPPFLAEAASSAKSTQDTSGLAVRIMFGFDEIEMIKFFDPVSQVSQQQAQSTRIYPLREVLWHEEELEALEANLEKGLWQEWKKQAGEAASSSSEESLEIHDASQQVLTALRQGLELAGEELLFPLAYPKSASLSDYLPEGSQVVLWGMQKLEQQEDALELERETLYQQSLSKKEAAEAKYSSSAEIPLLIWQRLLKPQRYASKLSQLALLQHSLCLDEFTGEDWPCNFSASLQYHGNMTRFQEDLKKLLADSYEFIIGCSSHAQAQRLAHSLKDFAPSLRFVAGELRQGFLLPDSKLAFLQEWEILGKKMRSGSRQHPSKKPSAKQEKQLSQSQIIDSFVELKPGDLVVHVQHGIGCFKGIERVSTSRLERDYLCIEYADANTLFVPIEQINLVQRYIGNEGSAPKLDRIGGKSWQERKSKTQKAVEDLAERLLRLYSRRAEQEGFPFPEDDEMQEEFEADFPYNPTTDQLQAVSEIKADMQSPWPMDRLLCGDVGFGKTEVSMRAAFKAASAGKQVIVLCPTTILAEQHYLNFQKRFARFPIRIAMLSRFVETKQQKVVIQQLEKGEVDILVGTHKVLSKSIRLNRLGLIIIDEEQRFGVKHKERLKLLKTSVDSLSMSATPIPRTLHMSLVQIREISMLNTPPRNRHPVETFVREFNPETVASAIRYELERGGQVFYLHNRVEGLEEILSFLQGLVPEALIEMAHGQMDGKELEDIMYRFVHQGFNVLLATSIIENGIDIPNVNTIIIDRADRFGIGQLYQLRGRVGRSDRLAYAYMFYPDRASLSELAMKRLSIIADFTELGSGFKVAMKDLEVRGAGNLLGPEQSGNILSVGFEMYASMLSKTMAERSEQAGYQLGKSHGSTRHKQPEYSEEITLELDYSGFIPDAYIPEAEEKIDLYKRISSIDRAELMESFYEELHDRFGNPPAEVRSLLSLIEIRIVCRNIGVNYLKERSGQVELHFSKLKPLPIDKIMQQIKKYPQLFRIEPAKPDALFINLGLLRPEFGQMAKLDAEKQSAVLLEKNSELQKILSSLY